MARLPRETRAAIAAAIAAAPETTNTALAVRFWVCPDTIAKIRRDADTAGLIEYPDTRHPAEKCPRCGALVYPPCLRCQLHRLRQLGLVGC